MSAAGTLSPQTMGIKNWSGRQVNREPTLLQQCKSFLVKADERFTAQPLSFMGDNAIGEVATGVEDGQSCFHRQSFERNIIGVEQSAWIGLCLQPDWQAWRTPSGGATVTQHPAISDLYSEFPRLFCEPPSAQPVMRPIAFQMSGVHYELAA
jgi:hypothetical protein